MVPYQAMLNRWVRPVIAEHEARGFAIGYARGLAIAAQRQDQLWHDWLARRTEAMKQRLPFNEPHPGEKSRTACQCSCRCCNE